MLLRHQEKCDLSSLGAVSDKTQLYIFPLPCASHRVASGFHKINNRLCYSKKILFKFSSKFKNVSLASNAAQTQLKLALQTFFMTQEQQQQRQKMIEIRCNRLRFLLGKEVIEVVQSFSSWRESKDKGFQLLNKNRTKAIGESWN